MNDLLLNAQNLQLTRQGHTLLEDASLSLRAGEVVGVLGPNGSGKSSCLKVLAGVMQADQGQLEICGRPQADWSRLELARHVAYLPQQVSVYWNFRVDELLELGASRGQRFTHWAIRKDRPCRRCLDELCQAFELTPLRRRLFGTLSGGEQARVLFAAAVATKPRILLADEPTASLDIHHQLALMRRLRLLASDTALLIVLHDLNLAARFVDRLVLFQDGRTILEGPTESVLASSQMDSTFSVPFQRMSVSGQTVLVPA